MFQSLAALCAPGPGHCTRLAAGVIRLYVFVAGLVSVNADTLATPKPRVSSARYSFLPSLETENEWMPEPLRVAEAVGAVERPDRRAGGGIGVEQVRQVVDLELLPALEANISARRGLSGSSQM